MRGLGGEKKFRERCRGEEEEKRKMLKVRGEEGSGGRGRGEQCSSGAIASDIVFCLSAGLSLQQFIKTLRSSAHQYESQSVKRKLPGQYREAPIPPRVLFRAFEFCCRCILGE